MAIYSFTRRACLCRLHCRAQRGVCLLLLLLATSRLLQGQSPDQRAALRQYQDSLRGMPTALLDREMDAKRERADTEATAMAQLRLGLAALAVGQRVDHYQFDRARGAFEQAARLEPDWPWPRYGIGLARRAIGEEQATNPLSLGTRAGYGQLERAVAGQLDAVAREPGFTPALLELADLVHLLQDSTLTARALAAFRSAAASEEASADTAYQLARCRLERLHGDPDSALTAIRRYREEGGDPGLADLEEARTLLGAGRREGISPYYEGARFDNPAAVAGYRADLRYIADSSELVSYDTARGDGRVAFLRRFWGNRDAWALREPGTRLLDHYGRLQYARRHFALEVNRRFYRWVDMYRSGSTELDDRGIVYVRQGPPEKRIAVPIFGFFPNETWRYKRADGDLLLHFSTGGGQEGPKGRYQVGGDLSDYHLIPSLMDAGTPGAGGDSLMLFVSRAPVTDLYAKLMTWGPEGQSRVVREERRIVALSTTLATQTDADELTFDSALTAVPELISLGHNGETTRVNVLIAIPATAETTREDQRLTTIRTRLGVFDSTRRPVASLDTTVALYLAGPLAPDSWILTRAQLSVPAGNWTYRLAVQEGARRGTVFPRSRIAVPRLDGSRAAMSDLVIAPLPGDWPWPLASGDTIYASPFQAYRQGQRINLYYEIYGLGEGEYTTRISVYEREGSRRGRRRIAILFQSTSAVPVSRVQRTIDLRGLGPGHYWLEVKAGSAMQQRPFDIVATP